MPSRLLTPKRRRFERASTGVVPVGGSTRATPILDFHHRLVAGRVKQLKSLDHNASGESVLRSAHLMIGQGVRAVYALDDLQPVSTTLKRGRGSCGQRLALLEALARGCGIATRARGLVVDGEFWTSRFPRIRALVPAEVVLAWPDFLVDASWRSTSDLFTNLHASEPGNLFDNSGPETLFEAITRTTIDWDGGACSACTSDLSGFVRRDLGTFDSRDDLHRAHGQTLYGGIIRIGDPFMSRWKAGFHG